MGLYPTSQACRTSFLVVGTLRFNIIAMLPEFVCVKANCSDLNLLFSLSQHERDWYKSIIVCMIYYNRVSKY